MACPDDLRDETCTSIPPRAGAGVAVADNGARALEVEVEVRATPRTPVGTHNWGHAQAHRCASADAHTRSPAVSVVGGTRYLAGLEVQTSRMHAARCTTGR
jgi:hypothetical protein